MGAADIPPRQLMTPTLRSHALRSGILRMPRLRKPRVSSEVAYAAALDTNRASLSAARSAAHQLCANGLSCACGTRPGRAAHGPCTRRSSPTLGRLKTTRAHLSGDTMFEWESSTFLQRQRMRPPRRPPAFRAAAPGGSRSGEAGSVEWESLATEGGMSAAPTRTDLCAGRRQRAMLE